MKYVRTLSCLMFLLLPTVASAQAAPQAPAKPAMSAEPASTLPGWDQLTPEQRDALVAPVRERWNASPHERARMLEHARRWQSLPATERERAHRGMRRFEDMDPQQRKQARVIFMHTRGMSAEESRSFRDRWSKMTPEQRQQWLHEHMPKDAPKH